VAQAAAIPIHLGALPRYYLDLAEERKALRKNEAHFTPAVSIGVGLREVIRMLEAEGLPNVLRRHDRPAGHARWRRGDDRVGSSAWATWGTSPSSM
jgi:aspartate aminotransferase-like enzyme